MRAVVLWGALPSELDEDRIDMSRLVGFDDLGSSGATLTEGSIGKGASGSGVGIALEIAERVVNDTASLIGLGVALRAAVSRTAARREREPAGASAEALTALAAAGSEAIVGNPERWAHTYTHCLTTDGIAGHDMRDVWAVAFQDGDRSLIQAVFMSSTTRYLGTVVVPVEWDMAGAEVRTDEQLRANFGAWY